MLAGFKARRRERVDPLFTEFRENQFRWTKIEVRDHDKLLYGPLFALQTLFILLVVTITIVIVLLVSKSGLIRDV